MLPPVLASQSPMEAGTQEPFLVDTVVEQREQWRVAPHRAAIAHARIRAEREARRGYPPAGSSYDFGANVSRRTLISSELLDLCNYARYFKQHNPTGEQAQWHMVHTYSCFLRLIMLWEEELTLLNEEQARAARAVGPLAVFIHLLRTEVNQERHEILVRHHMRQLGQKKMLHAVGHRALMRARQVIEHINIKLLDALQRYDEAMDLLSAVWDRALREGIVTVLVEERETPSNTEEWDGQRFMPKSLREIGLRVKLGHGAQQCPSSHVDCITVWGIFEVNASCLRWSGIQRHSPGSILPGPWPRHSYDVMLIERESLGHGSRREVGAARSHPQPPSISAPGPARTKTSIRGARRAAVSVQAPLIPRVSGALVHSGEAVGGEWREGRPFLLRADLYLDDIRPPLIEDVKPYHECGLCFNRKSHPVSHCFVCIRVWLKSQWTCPTCSTVMDGCPFRHWGGGGGVEGAYPEVDLSRVSYSWDGLVFPPRWERTPARRKAWKPGPQCSPTSRTPRRSSRCRNDGRRATTISAVVNTVPNVPDYYQDDPATNAALEERRFRVDDGINFDDEKKRYENSVWTSND
ncbi:hypothetical protein DFH07DRAFT_785927 [Mycena maculata]|uniref:Uncharacterized protein n=1 Tax=Mycena maculata TaxID=230809 RepID=A0AAD7H6A6_9AGAR|nr:hypothetical protein DFH07DRAFT_785927 [Mycena maculata]